MLFDVDEILDLQGLGLRVVGVDRDLRVAVAKEVGHLVQASSSLLSVQILQIPQ
jgi:hypothetical protein